jgi:hypothetical protein
METYLDSEGNKKSNLSLVARKSFQNRGNERVLMSIGNFDVLSRARNEEPDTNDEGLVQEASG